MAQCGLEIHGWRRKVSLRSKNKDQSMSDLVQACKYWKGFVAVRADMGPLRPKFTKPVCAEWRFRALVDEYLRFRSISEADRERKSQRTVRVNLMRDTSHAPKSRHTRNFGEKSLRIRKFLQSTFEL